MTTELKTGLEVFQAKERGEVVEVRRNLNFRWVEWDGKCWSFDYEFRIQPKPKKTVKYCLWGSKQDRRTLFMEFSYSNDANNWVRIPGTEVEVEE